MTVAVVILGNVGEALRAAVGLTLRGASVVVVPVVALPEDSRAVGTLRALGHKVDGTAEDAENADVVEVWT